MEMPEPIERPRPIELTGAQKALVEALSEKDRRLADMYIGALMALRLPSNPESLAQACHSLRELMEKIPRWYERVPAPEQLPRMNDKVSALHLKWMKMIGRTTCLIDGIWTGPIDRFLGIVLKEVDEFFKWLETDRPMRSERMTMLLQRLDPLGLPLPAKIEELRVRQWAECRSYFIEVAHHNATTTSEEAAQYVYFLERFLLDLVRPRTFEKHREIDTIIKDGERDADR